MFDCRGINLSSGGICLRSPISFETGEGIAGWVLKEGKADFVDIGRALVADPYFPKKAMEGRANDIRKCIACQRCSEFIIFGHDPLFLKWVHELFLYYWDSAKR
jgi:hypothetical protein